MHEHILTQAGLTEKEAYLYEFLLKSGSFTLAELTEKTFYKRGDLYNILEGLKELDLVEIKEIGGRKKYRPLHPAKLQDLIRDQEKEVGQTKKNLADAIPDLKSMYNVGARKPGVRFYEGYDDFWEVYNETLSSKDIIYTIVDEEIVVSEQGSMDKYDKKRRDKKITQYIIAPNTPASVRLYEKTKDDPYTEVRLLDKEKFPFQSTIDLFDNKIILGTYREDNHMMVVIEDPDIYKMQRHLFEMWWKSLE